MYYHIRITTLGGVTVPLCDIEDLETIKEEVLEPYLRNLEFTLDGHNFKKNQIESIKITSSESPANECGQIAYRKLPLNDEQIILPEQCVFIEHEFSKNITDEVLAQVRSSLPPSTNTEIATLALEIDKLKDQLNKLGSATAVLLTDKVNRRFSLLLGIYPFFHILVLVTIGFLWYYNDFHFVYPGIIIGLHIVLPTLGSIYGWITEHEFNLIKFIKLRKERRLKELCNKFGLHIKVLDSNPLSLLPYDD